MRGVFFGEDDARAVVARLAADGFEASCEREPFAGEDDDEDHPWVVSTDAPAVMLEILVEHHDGWLEPDEPPAPTTPLVLPDAPRRLKREASAPPPRITGMNKHLLLVHAHPDDESIGQGATMARYVAEGVGVTLVTCTGGEMGEILVPELEHMAADRDDTLADQRKIELDNAMKVLGVTDHRYLGGFKRYRDSGMKWHPEGHAVPADDVHENAFAEADLTEAAAHLVEVIREVRPQVMVTYDEFGGYGHPDHIQAHRVATYAAALAAVPSYRRDLGEAHDIAKIYWGAMSASRVRQGLRDLRAAGDTTTFEGMDPEGDLPKFMVDDADLTALVEADQYVGAKMDAMRAHATQIAVDGPFFALADNRGNEIWGTEFYRIAKGTPGPTGSTGLETDLFAGLG
jgi:N-acetyl-1-D-myo-inositol-2-amino-2-deoxy-alpha-D-glucopyranoside deacetylase